VHQQQNSIESAFRAAYNNNHYSTSYLRKENNNQDHIEYIYIYVLIINLLSNYFYKHRLLAHKIKVTNI